jgi:hypothetical protein
MGVMRLGSLDQLRDFVSKIEAFRVAEGPERLQEVISDLLCYRDGPLSWRGIITTRTPALMVSWVSIIVLPALVVSG